MTIRILTSQVLRFHNFGVRDKQDRIVTWKSSGNNIIEDAPDWITKDNTFSIGVKAKIITVLSDSSNANTVEKQANDNLVRARRVRAEKAAAKKAEKATSAVEDDLSDEETPVDFDSSNAETEQKSE